MPISKSGIRESLPLGVVHVHFQIWNTGIPPLGRCSRPFPSLEFGHSSVWPSTFLTIILSSSFPLAACTARLSNLFDNPYWAHGLPHPSVGFGHFDNPIGSSLFGPV